MGETIEDLLHFCRTMYSMKVDNAEYALLTAIVIFSGIYFIIYKKVKKRTSVSEWVLLEF